MKNMSITILSQYELTAATPDEFCDTLKCYFI